MDNQFEGTTVNERLFIGGYTDLFDNAVREKNIKKIIEILNNVEINDELAIQEILKAVGLK